MEVRWRGNVPLLIERNCPFLSVARKHPALCTVSVCTLSRLLGVRVVREQRFQDGDGCCVFRVCVDEPLTEEMPVGSEEPKPAIATASAAATFQCAATTGSSMKLA